MHLIFWNDPDIAKSHRIAVPLKDDGTFGNFLASSAGPGSLWKLHGVVNAHSVVGDRDDDIRGFLPIAVKAGSGELDIEGLPA